MNEVFFSFKACYLWPWNCRAWWPLKLLNLHRPAQRLTTKAHVSHRDPSVCQPAAVTIATATLKHASTSPSCDCSFLLFLVIKMDYWGLILFVFLCLQCFYTFILCLQCQQRALIWRKIKWTAQNSHTAFTLFLSRVSFHYIYWVFVST